MRRTMNMTTIPTADTGDGGASGRWPQVASVEHELFSRVRYPTPAREFRSHRLPYPGELSSGTDTDSRHQSPPVVPLPHMDRDQYITEVKGRVDHLEELPSWDPLSVANQLIQVPYRLANGETTFLYAVAEEYGGGTRLDPCDVLKHSPGEIPECAFDGKLERAAKLRLKHDLEAAKRGEL